MTFTTCLLALSFMWTETEAQSSEDSQRRSRLPGTAQKYVVPSCDRLMFDSNVDNCLAVFNNSMEMSGYQHRCPWPTVKSIYNELKLCVDSCAIGSWCKGHGFLVDKVFLGVHQMYFSLCGQLRDPPLITLFILISPAVITTLVLPLLCIKLTTWDTEISGI